MHTNTIHLYPSNIEMPQERRDKDNPCLPSATQSTATRYYQLDAIRDPLSTSPLLLLHLHLHRNVNLVPSSTSNKYIPWPCNPYILFPGQLLHHPARPLCLSPPEVVLAVRTSVLVPLLHCLRHLIPLFFLSYSPTLQPFFFSFFSPNLVTKIRVLASPCPPRGWLSDFLYLSFFLSFLFFARSPDSIHSLHQHLPLE